jgi:6-phosphogluconolactonase (cycloisomerase 2 family)
MGDGEIANPDWLIGDIADPIGIAISGPYVYIASNSAGTISRIELASGVIETQNWVTGLIGPFAIAISGGYMYVSNRSANTISKINLTDRSMEANWADTGLDEPSGIAISGGYMYVANYDTTAGTISKINMATGDNESPTWATGLQGPTSIAISGAYLYVTNEYDDTISKINLADGSFDNASWVQFTGGANPSGIVIVGLYVYVSSLIAGGSISKIRLSNPSIQNLTWATGMSVPSEFAVSGSYIYVTTLGDIPPFVQQNIYQINFVGEFAEADPLFSSCDSTTNTFRAFRPRTSSELLSLQKRKIQQSLNTVPTIAGQDSSEQTARIRKFASVMPRMPLDGNSATLVKFKASSVVQSMFAGQAYRNAASLYEIPVQYTSPGCSNILPNFMLYGPLSPKAVVRSVPISDATPQFVPFNPVVDLPLRNNDNKVVLQSVIANTAGCGANQ